MSGKIEAGIFKVQLNLFIFQCPVNIQKIIFRNAYYNHYYFLFKKGVNYNSQIKIRL